MSTYTRQLLHEQAPLIVHELREAFELHETQLMALAEAQLATLEGVVPEVIHVPFHFDQLQVYAVYRVQERLFQQLVAHAEAELRPAGRTFSITVFLTEGP